MSRRVVWLAVILLPCAVVGCPLLEPFIVPPDDLNSAVLGGIRDTRPYFGTMKPFLSLEQSSGDFLLASCGCGDWRVLFRPSDGSPQRQFPVRFYGTDDGAGTITAYGESEGNEAIVYVDQAAGRLDGRALLAESQVELSATRSGAHDLEVDACVMCHVGDDPIFPLPETHPKNYLENPRVCLDCHTVNGRP